jgi:uncharacterized UBP type Zn finger protein
MDLYWLGIKPKNSETSFIKKLPDYAHTRSLIPIKDVLEKTIKSPLSIETESIFEITKEFKTIEYNLFIKLGRQDSFKMFCVEKSWLESWKQYVRGGVFPGVIKTSKLLNKRGRIKTNIKKNQDFELLTESQLEFLSSMYGCEGEIEYMEPKSHKKSNSILIYTGKSKLNLSIDTVLKEDDKELITIMDQKILPGYETKLSDTETFPIHAPIKITSGLENPGFLCYLNCAVQCLLSIPEFVSYFMKLGPDSTLKPYTSSVYNLIRTVNQLKPKVLRPLLLWKQVVKKFSPSIQHDVCEFIKHLLFTLAQEKPENSQIVKSLFQGTLRNTLECTQCGYMSTKVEDFMDISVEFTPTLKRSLKRFTKCENLSFYCDNCVKFTKLSKQISIQNSPNILIIQVKRFLSSPSLLKIDETCEFHKNLVLETNLGPKKYNLIGITQHKGSLNYGHYTAYCKRSKKWYKFNDSKVKQVSLKEVLQKKIYLAIYKSSV